MSKEALYGALIVLSAFISAISQVMLKKAAMKTYDSPLREYLNIPVILAYLIFGLATVMTVWAYRGIDVSQGTLLETSGYIFVFLFDVMFFHQKVNARKLAGSLLIIGGILIATV